MNKKDEEIKFVTSVITHPAGYDLDLFGMYCVRPTDQGVWCVSWEENGKTVERTFNTPEVAAAFFVNMRHEREAGIDIETKLFRKEYEQIIFALDVSGVYTAQKILVEIEDYIGVVKVGPELLISAGDEIFYITKKPIFLDLKLHDIPATVERTVEAAVDRGVKFLTIHCAQSGKTIEQAVKRTEGTDTTLVGVTVLTSMTLSDLHQIGIQSRPANYAQFLALHGKNHGLDAFVCSSQEVKSFRCIYVKDSLLMVPGIRMADGNDDQKRTGTPEQAIRDGANYLVIGRPIRDSDNRIQTINQIVKQMSMPQ